MKNLIFVILFLGFSAHAVEKSSPVSWSSRFLATGKVMSDPENTVEQKSQDLHRLFSDVDSACQLNCRLPIEGLVKAIDTLNSWQIVYALKAFGFKHGDVLAHYADKTRDVLTRIDDDLLKSTVHSAIQLLRFFVSIHQNSLFEFAKADAAERKAIIDREFATLKNQKEAITKFASSFSKGQDASALTDLEIKQIAATVSHFRLIVFSRLIEAVVSNAGLLAPEVAITLNRVQQQLPLPTVLELREIVFGEFGMDPDSLYEGLDFEHPIRSDYIAVYYRARTREKKPRDVVVKIQRPNLDKQIQHNYDLNHLLLSVARTLRQEGAFDSIENSAMIYCAMDVALAEIESYTQKMEFELDFRLESQALEKARDMNIANFSVQVPKPLRDYSTIRILTTLESPSGISIDKLMNGEGSQVEQSARAEAFGSMVRSFIYQTFVLGQIPGEASANRIEIQSNGNVSLNQWSHVFQGRVPMGKPLKAVIYLARGDSKRFARAFAHMGRNPNFPEQEFEQAVQQILDQHEVQKKSGFRGVNPKNWAWSSLTELMEPVLAEAYKLGFEVSPQYVEFVRSVAPFGLSVYGIAKTLPTKTLAIHGGLAVLSSVVELPVQLAVGKVTWMGRRTIDKCKALLSSGT